MKVESIKFQKKTAEVIIDGQKNNIELELIFKYNITVDKQLTLTEYANISNENDEKYYLRIGLEALKKSLTTFEFKEYLKKNGAKEYLINKITAQFIEKKYLNDLDYALNYLELKGFKKSFLEIEIELSRKGISNNILNALKNSYHEKVVLNDLVEAYFTKRKKTPRNKLIQDAKNYFYQKGFNEYLIEEVISQKSKMIIIDERNIIYKDYQKLLNKYNKDLTGIDLKNKIKEKLYAKGYNKRNIEEVVSENLGL